MREWLRLIGFACECLDEWNAQKVEKEKEHKKNQRIWQNPSAFDGQAIISCNFACFPIVWAMGGQFIGPSLTDTHIHTHKLPHTGHKRMDFRRKNFGFFCCCCCRFTFVRREFPVKADDYRNVIGISVYKSQLRNSQSWMRSTTTIAMHLDRACGWHFMRKTTFLCRLQQNRVVWVLGLVEGWIQNEFAGVARWATCIKGSTEPIRIRNRTTHKRRCNNNKLSTAETAAKPFNIQQ